MTITVTDNGTNPANLTDAETITITVDEVNVAPVLGAIGNKSVDEQATLTFTATATDQDLPAQTLTYSLDAASLALGMTINAATGAFSWTPSEVAGRRELHGDDHGDRQRDEPGEPDGRGDDHDHGGRSERGAGAGRDREQERGRAGDAGVHGHGDGPGRCRRRR